MITKDSQKEKEPSNQISLTLPEWTKGKHIYIFAGSELVAVKECVIARKDHKVSYKPLLVKTGRCNGCGKCCEDGNPFVLSRWKEIYNRVVLYDHIA